MIENNITNRFICDKCDDSFHSKWRLMKHMNNHGANKRRNCHYFNSGKLCPFQQLGCKFPHKISDLCRYGEKCDVHTYVSVQTVKYFI